ncbi:transposase, partial [Bradyrhizobium sp. 180]|nr:transposase [Bradyrhizobium sp. 180]
MRVEVLGGLERRRRWSQDDKARIVEETLVPGAKVTEVYAYDEGRLIDACARARRVLRWRCVKVRRLADRR